MKKLVSIGLILLILAGWALPVFAEQPAATAQEEWAEPQAQNGWSLEDGTWYYYQNGTRVTGWMKYNNKWYMLSQPNGGMKTGWYLENGKWYFLDRANGDMKIGWWKDGGYWFYLDWHSGARRTGWLLENGKWYYLDPNTGVMRTGTIEINGKNHVFADSGVWQGEA